MQLYFRFIEEEIRKFYNLLDEKNQRLFAAVEAIKIWHGGISYIAKIVGCTRKTVARGIRELLAATVDDQLDHRVRQVGGGCKPYDVIHKDINEQFLDVLKNYTAGDPMNENIKWTNLTPDAIKVGLIYRPAVVSPVSDFKLLTSAVDPRFIDTKSRPSLGADLRGQCPPARASRLWLTT